MDTFGAALAGRLDRATLLWSVNGWRAHRTDRGISITGPKGEALTYAWVGVDLDAIRDPKVPFDRDFGPSTSPTHPSDATKINILSEADTSDAEEPSEGEGRVGRAPRPTPTPADTDAPPKRTQRFLGEPPGMWEFPSRVPGGLPW